MRQAGFTHETNTRHYSYEWYTPPAIFDALGLRFDMDVASPGADIVPWIPADTHLTLKDDALRCAWKGRVWMNPPYGKYMPQFVERFIEHGNGIMFSAARTDTKWFQRIAACADAICFLSGRARFVDSRTGKLSTNSPGSGHILVAFGSNCAAALRSCGLGYTVTKEKER